jgi:hypothetical protein
VKRGRSRRPLAVVAALGALLIGAAVLLPESLSPEGRSGESEAARPLVPDFPGAFDALLVVLVGVTLVSAAAVVMALGIRGDPSAPVRRRKSPVGLLALIVLTGLVASLYAARSREDAGPAGTSVVREGEPGGAADAGGAEGSRPLGLLLTGMVVLLVVGGPIAAWRYARARIPEEVRAAAFDERLLEEVDRGIADLAGIADPRAAVVAAYGRLQSLARWSGVPVRDSDTSSEVLDALAQRSAALEPSAARLVVLFRRARFSPHPLLEEDRAAALAALSEVRDRLMVSA